MMPDWQEAYFDLVNKVECECVQQGDLVPIWDQFKRMNLTIIKLQGHQGSQDAELAKWKALAETLAGALEQMHRAVCHETGFAEAVRADSGVAYPWEPLDVAADASIKALTSYKEQRDA